MTPEQLTALIVALTGLIGAIGVVILQVRQLRRDINGRIEQLVQSAHDLGQKRGELEGRDFMRRLLSPPEGQIAPAAELEDTPRAR